jgi:hypothetical protein
MPEQQSASLVQESPTSKQPKAFGLGRFAFFSFLLLPFRPFLASVVAAPIRPQTNATAPLRSERRGPSKDRMTSANRE